MTIKHLKEKATAAELALIEAVEECVSKDVRTEILRRAERFVLQNPAPTREDARTDDAVFTRYAKRFAEALSTTQP